MQKIDFMGLCLILQVLVSIQSLILVPEPYFNEPGYEILLGTAKGKRCSQSYNEEVLLQTVVHAMISQLKKPSSGFEDVIRTHFWIKKKRILTV
jgi:baculoviral IAP repeat-containing protein 6